jgi:hypothetical protein
MIIGTFDIVLIATILVLNIVFRKWIMQQKIGCLAIIVLFGLILPLGSMMMEANRILAARKVCETHDVSELLYLFIKFKLYWIIGIIQVIAIRNRPQ